MSETKPQYPHQDDTASADPINQVQWRLASSLHANSCNPNVVFTPELKLLERSILKCGWIQPIIVATSRNTISATCRPTRRVNARTVRLLLLESLSMKNRAENRDMTMAASSTVTTSFGSMARSEKGLREW